MKDHEAEDAAWMAKVGVDYLKVDDMSGQPRTEAGAYADYARIRDALNATGRPIFFSTCGHSGGTAGHPVSPAWMGSKCAELANACRIASDVRFWGPGTFGTNKAVNAMAAYNGSFSHAGSWPDPDLIFSYGPVGPSGFKPKCQGAGQLEYCTGSFCDPVPQHSVTQFGLWALMGAPILLSFDLQKLNSTEVSFLYGNPEIIAVSQDADEHGRGTPGGRRVSGGDFEEVEAKVEAKEGVGNAIEPNVWTRNLHDGSTAIIFVNNGDAAVQMVCDQVCLNAAGLKVGQTYAVRDLFTRKDLPLVTLDTSGLTSPVQVPGDAGSVFLRLTPK